MSSPVLLNLARPASVVRARAHDVLLIMGFSLAIAGCSQVAIPLPFTPVPVTLQTFAILLAGCLLGSRRGTLAVLAYIGEGLAGLPVFAGGAAGISHLFGPTGGYLVGFVAAAFVTGLLTERGAAVRWPGALLTLALGDLVLFVPGVAWLSAYTGVAHAVSLGFLPFAAGDALKIIAGCGVVSGVALLRRRARG